MSKLEKFLRINRLKNFSLIFCEKNFNQITRLKILIKPFLEKIL
jgi:hypothetical protein